MAINWKNGVKDGEPTWKGRVLELKVRHGVRIMSDVWANFNYAVVWDDKAGFPRHIDYANSEFGSDADSVTVDATKATIKKWEAWKQAEEAKAAKAEADWREAERVRLEQEREDRAMRICLYENIGKGDRVRVVKGRKVPKGTEGTIFWTGHGNYGPRCGLKEDGAGENDAHWTAISNLVRILPDVPHGTTPKGGWAAYLEAKEKVAAAAAAKLPKKGEWVALKADNGASYGKVFWVKGERLGFKLKKADEPTWANADEVVVMTGDPRKGGKPRDPVQTEEVAEERKSGLEEMPWPYCAIKTLKVEGGTWKAYDGEGNFLLDMPAGAAAQVMERLAAA